MTRAFRQSRRLTTSSKLEPELIQPEPKLERAAATAAPGARDGARRKRGRRAPGGEALDALLPLLPLLPGESQSHYDALRARILAEWKPATTTEAIYAQDFVDEVWQLRRLGQARVSVIENEARDLVELHLVQALPSDPDPARRDAEAAALAAGWWRGEPDAVARVEALIGRGRLTRAAVSGRAIAAKMPVLIGLEGLIRAAARGRDDALRSLLLVREALAALAQPDAPALAALTPDEAA